MRHDAIAAMPYAPPAGKAGEVEARTVAGLRAQASQAVFSRVQRPDFHQLVMVTSGVGRHMVDFAAHELHPGTVLWVRPGQVQQWGTLSAFDGHVLLFPAGLVTPDVDRLVGAESPHGPTLWRLDPARCAELEPLMTRLEELSPRADLAPELRAATLRHLLGVVLLQLAAVVDDAPPEGAVPEAFLAFRDLVEQRHRSWHDVGDYARELGWSPRTLARATARARGMTPKQIIDERLVLEARRLLAHSARPVHRIGAALGFDDASNFTAWFRQRTGVLPSRFRADQRVV
ncbi:AraC family transcriptional regulator [Nesterenkonia sp. F]|uniref:helix-turn-helix domain-containing protein n=1 Tax=Nesterenkonia sp. F TaxID=795955 RepID=UPI000255D006|nr:AraC family transcriptional regulator [Nesterenkonia sp. F]